MTLNAAVQGYSPWPWEGLRACSPGGMFAYAIVATVVVILAAVRLGRCLAEGLQNDERRGRRLSSGAGPLGIFWVSLCLT